MTMVMGTHRLGSTLGLVELDAGKDVENTQNIKQGQSRNQVYFLIMEVSVWYEYNGVKGKRMVGKE